MDSFILLEHTKKRKEKGLDPYTLETAESINRRILYYCRKKKININKLALRSGITPSTLKSILYGKSKNTGIVTLRHICDGLNMSLEEFFHNIFCKEG
jgi:transcriptional regulator with XRE-family HTH domain